MFTGILKSGLSSGMKLADIGGINVSWSTPEPTGVELYINGIRYNESETYNQNSWNLYAIKFNSGVSIPNNLRIGFGSDSFWIADNISVFTNDISASDIGKIYKEYFGTIPTKVVAGYPEPFTGSISEDPEDPFKSSILILDSELSNGSTTFQPLIGQEGFYDINLCPRLASTSDNGNWVLTGTGPTLRYSFTNLDNEKIDNIQPSINDLILLKNQSNVSQNGIYRVTSSFRLLPNNTVKGSTYFLNLLKQSDPPVNSLIFVRDGFVNKNYYFKRTSSNEYINSVVQRKTGSYDKLGHAIMVTVPVPVV
jgi:hypothetical protein